MINMTKEQVMEKVRVLKEKYKDFPFPVIALAKELGIKVLQGNLETGISGFICKEEDKYSIYVQETDAPARKTFTIAHELGHLCLHKEIIDQGNQFVVSNNKILIPANAMARQVSCCSDQETKANEFAANLLMPETQFSEMAMRKNDINEIAEYFGVSCSAASVRASNLGVIFI